MARKVPTRLVALGAAAIVGVYAVGFARTTTTPASTGSSVQSPASAIARAIAGATSTPTAGAGSPSVPGAATAQAGTAEYRDGTFSSTGTSRMGNITAEVTVEGGQITAVRITNSTTHYSTSRIAQLPGQVVSRQSANVSLVSGATYSASAFKQAVAQALAQASATA